MSVAEKKSSNKISDEAFDLLSCFVAGLDDVVCQAAEQIARRRLGKSDPAEPIEIGAEDIVSAGEAVIQLLRGLITQGGVSPELGPILDRVEQCFSTRRVKA
jgi:hypothetical protein